MQRRQSSLGWGRGPCTHAGNLSPYLLGCVSLRTATQVHHIKVTYAGAVGHAQSKDVRKHADVVCLLYDAFLIYMLHPAQMFPVYSMSRLLSREHCIYACYARSPTLGAAAPTVGVLSDCIHLYRPSCSLVQAAAAVQNGSCCVCPVQVR